MNADAMNAAGPCGPWGNVARLDLLATGANDWEPALSPDERVLVFSRGNSGDLSDSGQQR